MSLAGRKPGDIDFIVVREIRRRVFRHRRRRLSGPSAKCGAGNHHDPYGTNRILRFAFELANSRPSGTSHPRPNRRHRLTMPWWDKRVEEMAAR